MRRVYGVIFAVFTGIAVLWLTAPDLVALLVPGLPRNRLEITITSHVQHLHFSHYATGTAWLIWIALMIVGWRMKRWGSTLLGIGVPMGLIGTLPLLPIARLGGTSVVRIVRRWDWIDLALVAAVALVLAAKVAIWFCWWRLAVARRDAAGAV